ncbi:hypothetical protein [Kitasatospora sp. NPDC002040]|uniref:hypothetical protein n=1 Tax=Kitasatospora sp. NPDC002040 TaxID=3154661 RepID=UPI003316818D
MDLKQVFDEAVGDASPELRPLVAGALRDGAALRRRTVGTAGAVAAVAVAVAAVAIGGALMAAPERGAVLAATPTGGTPGAGSGAGVASAAAEQVALGGQAAVQTLLGLLPAGMPVGQYVGRDGLPGQAQPEVRAEVSYRSGPGTASIGVTVTPQFAPDGKLDLGIDGLYDCAHRGPSSAVTCHSTVRPDGSRLLVWQSLVRGQVNRGADVLRADGVRITAATESLMDSGHEKVLRAEPPLTTEQLEALVLSPAWQARITAAQAARAAAEITPYTDGRATISPKAP